MESKTLVNAQISELKSAPDEVKNAFLGAMIMKKAGLGGNPASKLKLFKQGHKLLEGAIAKDPENAEFRFLRLMIQENAPGYWAIKMMNKRTANISGNLIKRYRMIFRQAIADYSKKSKILKLQVS